MEPLTGTEDDFELIDRFGTFMRWWFERDPEPLIIETSLTQLVLTHALKELQEHLSFGTSEVQHFSLPSTHDLMDIEAAKSPLAMSFEMMFRPFVDENNPT